MILSQSEIEQAMQKFCDEHPLEHDLDLQMAVCCAQAHLIGTLQRSQNIEADLNMFNDNLIFALSSLIKKREPQ